jgi:hypothetical protein
VPVNGVACPATRNSTTLAAFLQALDPRFADLSLVEYYKERYNCYGRNGRESEYRANHVDTDVSDYEAGDDE